MNPTDLQPAFSRRTLLKTASSGFGYLAFAGLSTWAAEKSAGPLAPKAPHFPARAKRVIFLCMEGGPSHVDTFDYKPKLNADDGKPIGKGRAAAAKLLASPWKFEQHGQSGLWVSDLFPEVAKQADDLCIVNGMHTDIPNHPQAFLQMHTGLFHFPRPSMGAWVLYGLGTENENLPGFITLCPPDQQRRAVELRQLVPAGDLPGDADRLQRAADRQCQGLSNLANPKRRLATQRAAARSTCRRSTAQTLEHDQVNPAVEGRDRVVRAGLPDAGRAAAA